MALRWRRQPGIWIWLRACCDVGCGRPQRPLSRRFPAELAEIAALKKEVAKLKAERDILKKAAAFFAREAT